MAAGVKFGSRNVLESDAVRDGVKRIRYERIEYSSHA